MFQKTIFIITTTIVVSICCSSCSSSILQSKSVRVGRFRKEEYTPLSPEVPVTIQLEKDFVYGESIKPPVQIGAAVPAHRGVAIVAVAGSPDRPENEFIAAARKEARLLGCDGLYFRKPGFFINYNNIKSAGFYAFKTDSPPFEKSTTQSESLDLSHGQKERRKTATANENFVIPHLGMEMAWIEPGVFVMGSPMSPGDRKMKLYKLGSH